MDVLEAIAARRSIRKYKPTPIPEDKLNTILKAARLAPSFENYQPWKFIIVRSEEKKRQVVQACSNSKFLLEAPIAIVACAFPDEAFGLMGGYMNSFSVDVAVALDHLTLAAVNEGLGTCWIGVFKEEKIQKALSIPDDVRVVAITPLGFPDEDPESSGRKPLEKIICYNTFE